MSEAKVWTDEQHEPGIKRIESNVDSDGATVNVYGVLPNVLAMVAECTELLDSHQAKNYVEFDLIPRYETKLPGYRVTVQRMEGMSPAEKATALEAELADALLIGIARGEKLGYVDADNDWRERYKQPTGRDYDEGEGSDE